MDFLAWALDTVVMSVLRGKENPNLETDAKREAPGLYTRAVRWVGLGHGGGEVGLLEQRDGEQAVGRAGHLHANDQRVP
jgi:hypothetical protein